MSLFVLHYSLLVIQFNTTPSVAIVSLVIQFNITLFLPLEASSSNCLAFAATVPFDDYVAQARPHEAPGRPASKYLGEYKQGLGP